MTCQACAAMGRKSYAMSHGDAGKPGPFGVYFVTTLDESAGAVNGG